MDFKSFNELLHVDFSGMLVTSRNAALAVVGDRAEAFAQSLSESKGTPYVATEVRVWLGLPILTAPFPLFVGAVMTERNAILNQMSVFAWLEDNYVEQPRAEVFGLTPFGEQPVLFVRDFDMDRPLEAWIQTPQPSDWARLVGIVIASSRYGGGQQSLPPDQAALVLMAMHLPADAQPFVEELARQVAGGSSLKAALRQRRKTTDAALMRACDGWRALSRATNVAILNPDQSSAAAKVLELAPPKRW
ncbi:MAG: hypothetical protein RMM31_10360 [Anaerolineae bacterium]|nr:hypothetical protein [Thermoflexales bacterium]MDW8396630.1 hypothetical protein [Anaerolineae bacterium]